MNTFEVDEVINTAEMELTPIQDIQIGFTSRTPVEGVDIVAEDQAR